jgi:hypothetical protein
VRLIQRCLLLCGLAVVIAASPAIGQTPQGTKGPVKRTAWGDPDVSGVWDTRIQLPFQRPRGETREFYTEAEIAAKEKAANDAKAEENRQIADGTFLALGDRCFPVDPGIFRDQSGGVDRPAQISRRTSAIIDPPIGRLPPWTRAAMTRWEAREAATKGRGETDSWLDRGLAERCITRLSPANGGAPTRRILQFPGYVAITTLEIDHAGEGSVRIIPLDGRPKLPSAIRQWQGDSRGHFEGDTLVIEITNVNDKQTGDTVIVPHRTPNVYPGTGENLKVTERYRLIDGDMLEYRVTVEDPGTYIRPYTAVRELSRDDNYEMQPMSCHEGHRSIGGALAQARADEASALEYGIEIQEARRKQYERLKQEWAELWPEWNQGSR